MFSSIVASALLVSSVLALPLGPAHQEFVSNAAASSPNVTYSNSAVWYIQNGIFGACGKLSTDYQLVVGLGIEHYNLSGIVSPYCGSYVVVTNPLNNESVTARIADASAMNNTLSLSIATWRAIKGDETSMKNVTWTFANSTQTDAAVAKLTPLSSNIVAEPAYAQPAVVLAPAPASSPASTPTATAFVAASPTFVAPSSTYVAPSSTYTPPAPSSTYVAPSPVYVAPTTTYRAPEPTYVAPAPAPAPQAPSGQYSGDATFYFQNGIAGACGTVNGDGAMIVAMDSRRYGGNGRQGNCGRQVRITRESTGKTIYATVADACPTCNTGDSLDLSVAAFNSLGTPSEGLFKISWSFA